MALPDLVLATQLLAALTVIAANVYVLGLRAGWWKRRRPPRD